jgi:hypothetical protein
MSRRSASPPRVRAGRRCRRRRLSHHEGLPCRGAIRSAEPESAAQPCPFPRIWSKAVRGVRKRDYLHFVGNRHRLGVRGSVPTRPCGAPRIRSRNPTASACAVATTYIVRALQALLTSLHRSEA